jgi:hypothetical protein
LIPPEEGVIIPISEGDTDILTQPHDDNQWAPLNYPNLTEFLEEIQSYVMPFFTGWGEESSDEDMSPCPSPPPPPITPPPKPPLPIPPFQSF